GLYTTATTSTGLVCRVRLKRLPTLTRTHTGSRKSNLTEQSPTWDLILTTLAAFPGDGSSEANTTIRLPSDTRSTTPGSSRPLNGQTHPTTIVTGTRKFRTSGLSSALQQEDGDPSAADCSRSSVSANIESRLCAT